MGQIARRLGVRTVSGGQDLAPLRRGNFAAHAPQLQKESGEYHCSIPPGRSQDAYLYVQTGFSLPKGVTSHTTPRGGDALSCNEPCFRKTNVVNVVQL